MAYNRQVAHTNCFIEFRVQDPERFVLLERFFDALRDYTKNLAPTPINEDATIATRGGLLGTSTDGIEDGEKLSNADTQTRPQFIKPEEWLLALRPQDLDALRMPSHREAILAIRDWQGLSRRERRNAIKAQDNKRQLRGLADFMDMLKYWQDVEFELVALEQTDSDLARIRYQAFDYPFKGKVALEELLMFFGFLSILRDSC